MEDGLIMLENFTKNSKEESSYKNSHRVFEKLYWKAVINGHFLGDRVFDKYTFEYHLWRCKDKSYFGDIFPINLYPVCQLVEVF